MGSEMEISGKLLVASALAGSLARIPTHPLDTMKARMMASTSKSFIKTFTDTLRYEGITGFYRGFWFTALASLPASCIYFTSQEWSRAHIFPNSLMSGFFAESVSCLLYVPIDVIKERMQVQQRESLEMGYGKAYGNGISALKHILRQEGVRGLYKGYFSTLASFGPFSALYFYFYEFYRKQIEKKYVNENIPSYAFWFGGGICGAGASFLTTPLDLVKLRKQLDPASLYYYRGNMIDGLKKTLSQEGVPGLFRGATARVLFFSPATAFSMAIFETLKGL